MLGGPLDPELDRLWREEQLRAAQASRLREAVRQAGHAARGPGRSHRSLNAPVFLSKARARLREAAMPRRAAAQCCAPGCC